MPELMLSIPLAKLKPSPNNYRRHLGDPAKITEMAASMKEHGVLEPVIVRPMKRGDGYELVCGHRRFAAAKEAGLAGVPAIAKTLTDDQVLDIALIENSHREDVHPLDEAEAFAAAVKRGRAPGAIADSIGRPASYVALRMQLLKLSKSARKALDDGKVTLAVAQLVARIPDAKLQDEAIRDIYEDSYDGPVTADAARKLIEERYMLRLGEAPFDVTDAKLVPKAGACSACPKRTGAQAQLFADVKNADLCTDPECFKGKKIALFQIRLKDAKKNGQEVLDGKAALKALGHGSGFVSLDHEQYVGNQYKLVRKIVAKAKPPVTLAQGRDGEIHELIRVADLNKCLPKAEKRDIGRESAASLRIKAEQKRREAKDRQRAQAVSRAITIAVAIVPRLGDKLVPLLVRALVRSSWDDTHQAIVRSRELDKKKGSFRGALKAVLAHADTLDATGLAGLGLEIALRKFGPSRHSPANPEWSEALKVLKIDFAAIERQIAKDAKDAKAKAPKKKAAAKKATAKKSSKRKGGS